MIWTTYEEGRVKRGRLTPLARTYSVYVLGILVYRRRWYAA